MTIPQRASLRIFRRAVFIPVICAALGLAGATATVHGAGSSAVSRSGGVGHFITGLSATFKQGQVFLIWRESDLPAGSLLNVYRHTAPITGASLAQATLIGHHIQPGSARDWWKDPSAFKRGDPPAEPVGFRLDPDEPPLDPSGGLFVHTVTAEEGAQQYYAVTWTRPDGVESGELVTGANSLGEPVAQQQMPTRAIWVGTGEPPRIPPNLPIVLRLAGGAGPNDPNYNWLGFGDATMGWREGLSFKFKVVVAENCLYIYPSDRVWYNRSLGGPVSHFTTPAGIALHFGYNSKIYDERAMADGVIVNFNEKRLLWILDWAHRTWGTDRNRVHAIGASGGGAGLMLALHHPSVFASVCALVPCVSYRTSTDPAMAANDAYTKVLRLLGGEYEGGVPFAPGLGGFDSLDGVACLARPGEFPFLVLTHGRQDRPTPWSKVPAFLRALDRSRAGFLAWWDDGEHGTAGKAAPADVREAMTVEFLLQFSKGTSYPVFNNCSDSRNPGNGDPRDGDIVGWMNRGFRWRDVSETARSYSISIQMTHPDVTYPVSADVTLSNRQAFQPEPGQRLTVIVEGEPPREVVADEGGRVTIPGVVFSSPAFRRIEMAR